MASPIVFIAVLGFITVFSSGAVGQSHRPHCVHTTGKLITGEEQLHPGARRFILNIGSFYDPPTPFDNETIVVAVEARPESAAKIPVIPNRYVLTAAVSDGWGLATFNHFEDSSSLLEGNFLWKGHMFANKGRQGAKIMVPTLPLSALLNVLQYMDCWFLKVDTQGMDLNVIKSGRHHVKKCQYIMTEVYCNGHTPYKGAENDLDLHWMPFMTQMGFKPVNACACGPDGPNGERAQCESNIIWQNLGRVVEPVDDMKKKCPFCFA